MTMEQDSDIMKRDHLHILKTQKEFDHVSRSDKHYEKDGKPHCVAFTTEKDERDESKKTLDSEMSDNKDAPITPATQKSTANVYKHGRKCFETESGNSEFWEADDKILMDDSVYRNDFKGVQGERYSMKLPAMDSDMFKGDGATASIGENRERYSKAEDRYGLNCPQDSDSWKNEGKQDDISSAQKDYETKRNERNEFKKMQDSDLFDNEDGPIQKSIACGFNTGRRHAAVKPKDSDFWETDPDIPMGDSVYRSQFKGVQGEKDGIKLLPENSNMFKEEEARASETRNKESYSSKPGDHYHINYSQDFDVWKLKDNIQNETVSRSDYTGKTVGRSTAKKPQDSDIFTGSDSYTTGGSDFVPHVGEHYPVVKHDESDVWKREGNMTGESIAHGNYTDEIVEGHKIRAPVDTKSTESNETLILESQSGYVPRKGEHDVTRQD